MRQNRLCFRLLVTLLAALAALPALATCDNAYMLRKRASVRLPGSCNYCQRSPVPNFTPSAAISFWALGSGDPAPGRGNDSGRFLVAPQSSDGRAALLPFDYSPQTPGKIESSRSDGPFYNYYMMFNTNWGAAATIDGCVGDTGEFGSTCTCLLLEDQFNGRGFFALLSKQSDAQGDFEFSPNHTVLAALPRPELTDLVFRQSDGRLEAGLTLALPAEGLELDPACDCRPLGFRLLTRSIAAGSAIPHDRRREEWTPAAERLAFGEAQRVALPCTAGEDLLVAAGLVLPDGFESRFVSEPFVAARCEQEQPAVTLQQPEVVEPRPADSASADPAGAPPQAVPDAPPARPIPEDWLLFGSGLGAGVLITLLGLVAYRKLQRH